MSGLPLLVFFVASLPVCLVRPFYGIVLWTCVAFLNPQSFVWGIAASFPLALAVGIPTLIGMPIFVSGWLERLRSREALLVFVLWGWFTATTLISTTTPVFIHHADDTWYKWQLVSKILLMTLATMAIVRDFAQLRTLLMVIAGCFGFFIVKAVPFMIVTGGAFRLYGPPNSMIADNNDFGLALNMTLPLFFFLAQTETRPWVRRLFWFLFVSTIPAIFFTYSRGALFGLVCVIALMIWQTKQKLMLIPVIFLAAVLALAFAPDSWKERMDPTGEVVDASAQSRLNAWSYCWNLALDYPVTGGGFATFTRTLFDHYAPNVLDVHNSHSIYFGVLAEHGFVGLGLFIVVVVSCFASARRMIRQAQEYEDEEAIRYANMLWFSILGYLISGFFLSRAYFDYYFTIVACMAILKRVLAERWAHAETLELQEEATV